MSWIGDIFYCLRIKVFFIAGLIAFLISHAMLAVKGIFKEE
jgi:uncharacterized membrane protein YhhN